MDNDQCAWGLSQESWVHRRSFVLHLSTLIIVFIALDASLSALDPEKPDAEVTADQEDQAEDSG